MSREIRMKTTIVGQRWVGGPFWPPYNGVLEVGDEEAARYVAAGHAVYLEDEPVPIHQGFSPLKEYSENYEPALDPDKQPKESAELTEYVEEETTGPKRPYTNALKEVWAKYAVEMGEDPEVAARMSKVDLISKYGASI